MNKVKYYVFSFVVILTCWDVMSRYGLMSEMFLPSPFKVFSAVSAMFFKAGLIGDILASSKRILMGFLASFVAALLFAMLMRQSGRMKKYLLPVISFFRYIPTSALVPLFILWFGIDELEKILIIFAAIFPFMAILILDAMESVKNEYIEVARTMGATEADVFVRVIVPHSLPQIWDGARFMMGASWTILILAEIIGADSGLGYLIMAKQRFVKTDAVMGLVIIIGVIGIFIDSLFAYFRGVLFPWSQKNNANA